MHTLIRPLRNRDWTQRERRTFMNLIAQQAKYIIDEDDLHTSSTKTICSTSRVFIFDEHLRPAVKVVEKQQSASFASKPKKDESPGGKAGCRLRMTRYVDASQ